MSYKGKFRPKNRKKYKGNSSDIVYRSLWELKFMNYCDNNKNIITWSSEEIIIPYRSPIDNRPHRYFPDFYVKYKDVRGKILEKLIEVKPAKEVKEPKVEKVVDSSEVKATPKSVSKKKGRPKKGESNGKKTKASSWR